jgi:hypothetical protein
LAKNSDHLAGGFETDDAGGVLSGLLAEEDELDRRMLWRIGSWGVAAIGAVILAVMANQTSLGLKRDQLAAADLTRHAQNFQLAAKESQNEARRLASAVETLNGDRDRLYARVTSLEQGLDSVTGAIARQGSQGSIVTAPPPAPATPAATAAPAPAVAPVASIQPTLSAPDRPAAVETNPVNKSSLARDAAKTDVAKTETGKPESAKTEIAKTEIAKTEIAKTEIAKTESAKPESAKSEIAKSEIAKSETAKSELGKSDTIKSEGGKADTAKSDTAKSDTTKTDIGKADSVKTDSQKADPSKTPVATPATPLVASKSIMAPPDPAAAKLIEPNKPVSAVTASPIPEVVASAPSTDEEADEAISQKVAIRRTEFGVDLGTANSVGGLRALWSGLLKSKSNAPLTALRPIIVIKERGNGLGMQLRLVAGPLNDAGAAARICAVLTENKRSCETTIFDGQRLMMNSEDPPPVARATQRRRGIAVRAVAEEPPKKPETSAVSAISSMFGRKGQ